MFNYWSCKKKKLIEVTEFVRADLTKVCGQILLVIREFKLVKQANLERCKDDQLNS